MGSTELNQLVVARSWFDDLFLRHADPHLALAIPAEPNQENKVKNNFPDYNDRVYGK